MEEKFKMNKNENGQRDQNFITTKNVLFSAVPI